MTDTSAQTNAEGVGSAKIRNTKGRRRATLMSGGVMEPVDDAFAHRSSQAFLVRESGEYDLMVIAKMIEQVLEPWSHIPAVTTALALGAKPLLKTDEGKRLRKSLNARELYSRGYSRKMIGVRFVIDRVVFQYGLTSGAATGVTGDNDWVSSVVELQAEWRPAEIVTGPMGRLARLVSLFNLLEKSITNCRTLVRVAEEPDGMDLTTKGGKVTWDALARYAENDYYTTLSRLLTGVVFDLKNGRYPRTAGMLPPGYVKTGGNGPDAGHVHPSTDLIVAKQVRHFIELCAGLSTDMEIAQEMGNLGWTTRNQRFRSEHSDIGIHKLGDPSRAIITMYGHLSLYLTGVLHFQHEMTLPHLDSFHGLEIHRFGPQDNGFFEVDLDFGLPDGGWHEDNVLRRAIKNRVTEKDSRPIYVERTQIKPLAGLIRYIDDVWEYSLMSNDPKSYELRRRETTPDHRSVRKGFDDLEGQVVGRFAARDLHRAVATALRQLSTGAGSSLSCPMTPTVSADVIEKLERARDAAVEHAERARREVVRHQDSEADAYRQLALESQAEAVELSGQIAMATASSNLPPGSTMDAEKIAAIIKILENLEGATTVTVHQALRALVRSFKFTRVTPGDPMAELELQIDLRTNTGTISAGPLRALVRNNSAGGKSGSNLQKKVHSARNTQLVKMLFLESVDQDERDALWEQERFNGRTYTRRMKETLMPFLGGPMASAILDCPILDVRRTALRPFIDHDLDVGKDFSPELQALVQATYSPVGFSWPKGWCPGGMARERQVLKFLEDYSPTPDVGMPAKSILSALQMEMSALYRMRHEGAARYGRPEAVSAPWYARIEIFELENGRGRSVAHVRVRQCPHCGERSLTQPLRVPEVPGYLLCTNPSCRKSLLSGVVFTDDFFLPWDGSQSYVRRVEGSGKVVDRYWQNMDGKIIVGTTLCEIIVPSPHAPRRIGGNERKK